jgi:redox-sensitive bicupin YhaK (pirin superfamily)
MLQLRKAEDRGHARHGWLESYHTFSFAGYHDPEHMGFRSLRVINEDRVQPGQGFGTHSHRDMEILSYVIEGALEHRDGMGNGSVIRPGELQLMRAGTGVTHSEYNPSRSELVHFLQIWILPEAEGLEPAYEQREFLEDERRGRLRRVASPDGAEGSLEIRQDASLYATLLQPGESVRHDLAPGRFAWLQVVAGDLDANGQRLSAGDGAAIAQESGVELRAASPAEALLFDLA